MSSLEWTAYLLHQEMPGYLYMSTGGTTEAPKKSLDLKDHRDHQGKRWGVLNPEILDNN